MNTAPRATPRPEGPHEPEGSLHAVRLQDALAQPWRNGGGITRELLAWPAPRSVKADYPADAAHADWIVRVSVADITQDGPFSAFPGIHRCFTVLEGAGVVLRLDGADLPLTPDSAPLAFDGAQAPGCRLINGATRDLNLMVRQSAGRAWMQRAMTGQSWQTPTQRQQASGGQPPSPQGASSQRTDARWAWRGLYAHGPACVAAPSGRIDLQAGTLLWSDPGSVPAAEADLTAPWCLIEGAQAWWLGLQAPGPEEDCA